MPVTSGVGPDEQLDVTVAIIVHGDPPAIDKTIDSVLAQDYSLGGLTILCLDDGTSPIARSALDHRGIWTVDLPLGSSISAAKNIALDLSLHEFVFFLDDHMYLRVGGLDQAMAAFRTDPGLAGICGYYRSACHSDWNTLRDIKRHSIYGKCAEQRPVSLDWFTTFSTGIGIVRRSVFLSLDFPEDLFPRDFGGEDLPAFLVALNSGHRFAYVPQLASLHEHNLTLKEFLRKVETEIRGRFGVFYWVSGQPELRAPYLHGFLNVPVLLYVTLVLGLLGLRFGSPVFLLVPSGLFAVECTLSLRCLTAPSSYPLGRRLMAACYVLASDLLTPLCALQYAVSSYKRPYAHLGVRRGLRMMQVFLKWEREKLQAFGVLLLTPSVFRRVDAPPD